mgnify:CR=1 FL=1
MQKNFEVLAEAVVTAARTYVAKALDKVQQRLKAVEEKLAKIPETGIPGPGGRDGVDGKDGAPGRDGVDGKDGAPGPAGDLPAPTSSVFAAPPPPATTTAN